MLKMGVTTEAHCIPSTTWVMLQTPERNMVHVANHECNMGHVENPRAQHETCCKLLVAADARYIKHNGSCCKSCHNKSHVENPREQHESCCTRWAAAKACCIASTTWFMLQTQTQHESCCKISTTTWIDLIMTITNMARTTCEYV